MDHPKVLISYSHDSDKHKNRVFDLSERLRSQGIDCHIDQYETSPREGWPRWMRNRIKEADYVLISCTEIYERRFEGDEEPGRGAGSNWEGIIVTQEMYESQGRNTKFIPIAFTAEDTRYIPVILRSGNWYIVDNEKGYEELYRHLTNQPKTVKGALGKQVSMPPLKRRQDFSAPPRQKVPKRAAHPVDTVPTTMDKPPSLALIVTPEGHSIFVEALRVKSGETVLMSLLPADGRQTASLEALKKSVRRDQLPIAFGTTAMLARLNSVEHVVEEGREVWHLEFQPDERSRGSNEFSLTRHSLDEIAEMRARRILLDEKLPGSQYRGSSDMNSQMLENSVRGFQSPIQVMDSPFPPLYQALKNDTPLFLAAARLNGTLRLLLTNTVEHIHVLELRMIDETRLSVKFEGQRTPEYSGEEPYILRVEGICNLATETK